MKEINKPSILVFLGLLIVGTAAMSTSQFENGGPLYGISTLIYLVIFVYLTEAVETKKALFLVWICFTAGIIVRSYGLSGIPTVDAGIMAVEALVLYVALLINRAICKKWSSIFATLFFPAMWVGIFYVALIIRIPAISRLDMMFFDINPVIQNVSIISSVGFTAVVVWIATSIAHGIAHKYFIPAGLGILVAGLLISMGLYVVSDVAEPVDYVKVAYSTGPYVGDFLNYEDMEYYNCVRSFDKIAGDAAKEKAEVLAFCEEAYGIKDSDEAGFVDHIKATAIEKKLHILVGFDVADTDGSSGGKAENKIIWIDDTGEVVGEYTKRQIIPIIEDGYVMGDGVIPNNVVNINGKYVKIAFAICYDSNFSKYISQIDDNTQILILPSWDWDGVTYMHSRICGTIAVENRVSLLKPTYDGYTIAVDPYGKILDFKSTKDTGYENVQIVDLPIYGRYDD